jgi:aromatic ring-opening dioxygenase catalytic subunit (LigB family)
MKAFFAPKTAEMEMSNKAFTRWLNDTCSNPNIEEDERSFRLENWENAPSARYCHPREEHLLPLHVCYGVANCACSEFFELEIIGKKASVYFWG